MNVKELDIVGPCEKINKQVRVSKEVAQHFYFCSSRLLSFLGLN